MEFFQVLTVKCSNRYGTSFDFLQIREDVMPFQQRSYEDNGDSNGVSVTSLPVIVQLQRDRDILSEIHRCAPKNSHSVGFYYV